MNECKKTKNRIANAPYSTQIFVRLIEEKWARLQSIMIPSIMVPREAWIVGLLSLLRFGIQVSLLQPPFRLYLCRTQKNLPHSSWTFLNKANSPFTCKFCASFAVAAITYTFPLCSTTSQGSCLATCPPMKHMLLEAIEYGHLEMAARLPFNMPTTWSMTLIFPLISGCAHLQRQLQSCHAVQCP